jgi:hypothetical protein
MLIGHINREIDTNILRENWEKNYPIRHFVEVTTGIYLINQKKN